MNDLDYLRTGIFYELPMAGLPLAANENDTTCHPGHSEGSAAASSRQFGTVRLRRRTQGFLAALLLGMTWFGHFLSNKSGKKQS